MSGVNHDDFVSFRELRVETRRGEKRVLIATPKARGKLDRRRLEALRSGNVASRLNRTLASELARRSKADETVYDAILFEAGSGRGQHLGFDEDLTDEEIVEFGELMIHGQLETFRQVAELGVAVLAGVEFGDRELFAYDRGSRRLAERLEQTVARHAEMGADPSEDMDVARARLYLWLLDHFAIWSNASADEFIERNLPDTLVSSERLRRKLGRMLSTAPTSED